MDISPPVTRIVMVGACYIDTILSGPRYPEEDEKLRAKSLEKRRGGNGANTLEVLEQLVASPIGPSLDLNLLCVLPNSSSPAAKFVKDSFGPNVDLSICIHREEHSEAASSFIVKGMENGSRTIVNYNDLPEMNLEEFQAQISKLHDHNQPTWFHFEGRIPETSKACMRWLREVYPYIVISAEAEKPGRKGLEEMIREADVVFYAKGWAVSKGFQDVRTFLEAESQRMTEARLLCCTWGAGGAAVIAGFRYELYHHDPSYIDKERQVVDTIGAGDTFVAGMLYHLITARKSDVKAALQFANKLAGRKVLQDGFAGLA